MPLLTDRATAGNTRSVWWQGHNVLRVYHGGTLVWPSRALQPVIASTLANTDRQLTATWQVANRQAQGLTVDWGDGSPVQALTLDASGRVTATHTYAVARPYSITATTQGAQRLDVFTLSTPHALVLAAVPGANRLVTLTTTMGVQAPVAIDWGDGSPAEQVPWGAPGANTATMTHTYPRDGQFTITGTDAGGTTTATVVVAPPLPTIRMSVTSMTLPGSGTAVANIDVPSAPATTTGIVAVMLLDGVPATLQSATAVQIPADAKTHTLQMQVTDPLGRTSMSDVWLVSSGEADGMQASMWGHWMGSRLEYSANVNGSTRLYRTKPWGVQTASGTVSGSASFTSTGRSGKEGVYISTPSSLFNPGTGLATLVSGFGPEAPPINTPFDVKVGRTDYWPELYLEGTSGSQEITIDWGWGDPAHNEVGPRVQRIYVDPTGHWEVVRDFYRRHDSSPFNIVITELDGLKRTITVRYDPAHHFDLTPVP